MKKVIDFGRLKVYKIRNKDEYLFTENLKIELDGIDISSSVLEFSISFNQQGSGLVTYNIKMLPWFDRLKRKIKKVLK